MTLPLPGDHNDLVRLVPVALSAGEQHRVDGTSSYDANVEVEISDRVIKQLDSVSPPHEYRENPFARVRIKRRSWVRKRTYEYDTTNNTPGWVVKTQIYRDRFDINETAVDAEQLEVMITRCRNQARAKLDDAIANANANVALIVAERNATISMIAGRVIQTGLQLEKAAREEPKAPRRNKRGGYRFGNNRRAKYARQISAYWLEFWFGWFPLVKDIESMWTHEPLRVKTPVSGRFADSVTTVKELGGLIVTVQTEVVVKLKATVEVTDPLTKTLNEWGLMNPLSVAWELIRLSWLIDYWFQVGNFLDSLSADVGVNVTGKSTTTSITHRVVSVTSPQAVDHGTYTSDVSVDYDGEFHYFSKVRDGGLPHINPFVSNGLSLSNNKSKNVIALVIAKLNRF